MKVITVCGSFKFKDEIMEAAMRIEIGGDVALIPIFPTNVDKDTLKEEEVIMLGKMHKEKIRLSDAILVVNVNGYIGSNTKSEIEFAKFLNKEIIYLEQI